MYTINQEDLVLHLYEESSNELEIAINAELQTNWSLLEEYAILEETKNSLGSLILSPQDKTVESILKYAEKSVNGIATIV